VREIVERAYETAGCSSLEAALRVEESHAGDACERRAVLQCADEFGDGRVTFSEESRPWRRPFEVGTPDDRSVGAGHDDRAASRSAAAVIACAACRIRNRHILDR
jgi:hypothetical protein